MREEHRARPSRGAYHLLFGSCLISLAIACGPEAPKTSGGDTSGATAEPGPGATTTSGAEPTTSATSTSTSTATDPAPTTAASDDSSGTSEGVTFIHTPDASNCFAPLGPGQSARCSFCDFYAQNCWPGAKCSPKGVDTWERPACVPVAPDPVGPGQPCAVEGGPFSGRDDCDASSMCWGVDPVTLQGTCAPFCGGAPESPICAPGSACYIDFDGLLNLCLPTCDPLLQDCPLGQLCAASQHGEPFVCLPAAPSPAGLFAPCDAAFDCAPALACVPDGFASECQAGSDCCVPLCDLNAPECPGADQGCMPWSSPPPAGLEHVGICTFVVPP